MAHNYTPDDLPVKVGLKMMVSVPVIAALWWFSRAVSWLNKVDARLDKIGDRIIAWAERNV